MSKSGKYQCEPKKWGTCFIWGQMKKRCLKLIKKSILLGYKSKNMFCLCYKRTNKSRCFLNTWDINQVCNYKTSHAIIVVYFCPVIAISGALMLTLSFLENRWCLDVIFYVKTATGQQLSCWECGPQLKQLRNSLYANENIDRVALVDSSQHTWQGKAIHMQPTRQWGSHIMSLKKINVFYTCQKKYALC